MRSHGSAGATGGNHSTAIDHSTGDHLAALSGGDSRTVSG